jgi:hypothetical protein
VPDVLPEPEAPPLPVVSPESPQELADDNNRNAAAGNKRYVVEFMGVFSPKTAWRLLEAPMAFVTAVP